MPGIRPRPAAVWAAALLLALAAPPGAGAQAPADTVGIGALEAALERRPEDAGLYVQLARAYRALGRTDRAEAVLHTGLRRAAEPGPVRWALVGLRAEGQRWEAAVEALEPLSGEPRARALAAKLRTNAGLAAYRAGETERARAYWEQALRDDPALTAAAANLGALLLESGRPDSARAVAERALRHAPDDSRLLALRAASLGGAEGLEAALEATRRARAVRPEDEAVGLRLARLLAAAGETRAAAALYDTLTAAPDASAAAHADAARFWLERGRWDRAAPIAEDGVGRHPDHGPLWALLGEAEAAAEDWEGAVVAYRRAAVRLDAPEAAELALIEAHAAAGDTTAALEVVRGMAERRASPRDALLRAARVAERLGGRSAAAAVYHRLLARDSADVPALEGAAAAAEAAGDTARALELYRRALALDSGPDAPLGLLRLTEPGPEQRRDLLRKALWRGVSMLQTLELQAVGTLQSASGMRSLRRTRPVLERRDAVGETVTAVLDTVVFGTDWGAAELERLRKAYPESALLDRYAARLAVERGRPEDALRLYDRLLRRSPVVAALHRGRARALEALGRTDEAVAAYTRALELEPEDEATFRALVRLHRRAGSLEALLRQVRRLRIRLPDSGVLRDREIELLHRLGRTLEADSIARGSDPLPAL